MSDTEWELELRSCLTSVKNGIPLSQIESDLFRLTGTQIPYKNLGYPSLEACLSSSKEFIICNHGGVRIVYAVPSNKTQHLTDLIKKQKSKLPKLSRKKNDLKIQQCKKINMSKSKKRKISECDNFSLYDEVTKFYKCNDINILLSSIEQWDIDTPNQYKHTKKFKCLVCFFQTNSFNCWKLHIMSINHLFKCDKIKDLYSYINDRKPKVLLYGPKESLGINTTKYLKSGNITGVPMLMAEVMKRFITKQNGKMYYCSHCKKYAEKPIHSDTEKLNTNIKFPVEYYCKYCRVHFYSCPEMLDYHSLSVEHMTLKCYNKFCHEGKMDFKKMKTSVLLNENKEENLLPNVKHKCVANSIPLSNVVQDISSFKNIDCIEVTNECRQTFLINKSSSNEDFGCIILSDQKSQELNPVNSKTYPNEITDKRSKLDVTTVSGETSSDNVTNLENEKVHKLDEDQEYGKYVTQRLKNIKNSTVKQNIKLEIDYLFYIQIKKMLQKNE